MDGTTPRQETLHRIAALLDDRQNGLPSVPEVLVQVQKAVNNQNVSARDLSRVILEDPALTASVLRLSNSAYYGNARSRVRTITSGIVLLGFENIRNLALGLNVYHMFSALPRAGHYRHIWRHSLCVAVTARWFAKRAGVPVPEEAFLCGLIHDIGKLILGHFFPEKYQQVCRLVETQQMSLLAAEQKIFSCDHMVAGRFLAEHWHFPPSITQIIGTHGIEPESQLAAKGIAPLAKVVLLANQVAHYLYGQDGATKPRTRPMIEELCREHFDLKDKAFTKFLRNTKNEVHEIASILDVAIDELTDRETRRIVNPQEGSVAGARANEQARLDFLLQATELAATADDFSLFLQETAASLFHALKLDSLFLLFKNHDLSALEPKFGYGVAVDTLHDSIRIDLSQDDELGAYAYLHDAHVILTPENQHIFSRISDTNLISLLGTLNIVAIPVHLHTRVAAILVLSRPYNTLPFEDEDLRILHIYVQQIDMIFARMHKRGGTTIIRKSERDGQARGE